MRDLGIDEKAITECVDHSFVRKGDRKSDNKLLSADRSYATTLGIVVHPTITVNNNTFRGEINGYNVFKAVCAGFKDMPDICKGDKIYQVLDTVD
jgi:hypothetical protein